MNAFTHLAHAVLGGRYSGDALFAMLTCYFDEAIEKEPVDGKLDPLQYTFVCGYVASIAQWERFEVDWKIFLAHYDVPHFHMKEFSQSTGPFKKWGKKEMEGTRIAFMKDASEIIRATVMRGFIAMLSNQIFSEIDSRYKVHETFGSAYAMAGRACVALANTWRSGEIAGPLDIKYVFEDGGPDKGGLIRSMTLLVPNLPAPSFEPGKDWKPSPKWPHGRTGIVQLQSADYLAYEVRRLFADQLLRPTDREVRKSLQALKGPPFDRAMLTTERLELICHHAKIESRN
jgi:hypothetical protein